MRVTPDARSYARHVAAGKPHEEAIAKAFHDGILHERSRAKKIEQLATSNAPTERPALPLEREGSTLL